MANLLAGWLGVLAGLATGSIFGLLFHRDDWLGGYTSYERRMVRLGHIAFSALGFLNLIFAVTAAPMGLRPIALEITSISFIVGEITMPICCFLTAWRKPLQHLFPVPVIALATGLVSIFLGWRVI